MDALTIKSGRGGAGTRISDFLLRTHLSSLTFPRLAQWKGPPRGELSQEEGERKREVKAWSFLNSLETQRRPWHEEEGRQQKGASLRYLVSRFADVRPIPSDTPFEKPRAAIAGVDPVVFPRAAVATHFTGDI